METTVLEENLVSTVTFFMVLLIAVNANKTSDRRAA